MKKNNLFKVIGIVILGYVALTWLVPIIANIFGVTETLDYQVGLVSGGLKLVETVSGFAYNLVFILLVGGFYAILEATGMYEKSLSLIVSKMKGKEKIFLIVIMVLMAIISSVTGLDLALLIVFPFIISLILMMGYDKLVALSATFGATIIGMYGSTYASSIYSVLNMMISVDYSVSLLSKVILFVLGLGLLIAFVLIYINSIERTKKNESKKNDKKTVKVAVAVTDDTNKTKNVWPLYVILGVLFLIFILGTTSWADIFGFNWFDTVYEKIMGWTIGDFALVEKVFGGIPAFGNWGMYTSSNAYNLYRFQYYSLLIIFASAILCIVYRIGLDDAFDAFAKGIKEYIVPTLLAFLAYFVFVLTYYYPILSYLTGLIDGITSSFNVAITGISSLISSFFYSDFYYYAGYVIYGAATTLEDTSLLPLVSIIYTNLYGLVMLIAPTSVLLLASLSITEVSYKTWFKFIWKLFLSLLIVSFIVFVIMLLI